VHAATVDGKKLGVPRYRFRRPKKRVVDRMVAVLQRKKIDAAGEVPGGGGYSEASAEGNLCALDGAGWTPICMARFIKWTRI